MPNWLKSGSFMPWRGEGGWCASLPSSQYTYRNAAQYRKQIMTHEKVAAHVEAIYQARRTATLGYGGLQRMIHSLRDVGLSGIADKLEVIKGEFDPLFDAALGLVLAHNASEEGEGMNRAARRHPFSPNRAYHQFRGFLGIDADLEDAWREYASISFWDADWSRDSAWDGVVVYHP